MNRGHLNRAKGWKLPKGKGGTVFYRSVHAHDVSLYASSLKHSGVCKNHFSCTLEQQKLELSIILRLRTSHKSNAYQ